MKTTYCPVCRVRDSIVRLGTDRNRLNARAMNRRITGTKAGARRARVLSRRADHLDAVARRHLDLITDMRHTH